MKYTSLKCPYCGSKQFNIVNNDIFLCEYCEQKFNYNIDEIEFTNDNKVLIEELKKEFYEKVQMLSSKKKICKSMVVYYSKLANKRFLSTFFIVCAIIAFTVLLSGNFIFPSLCIMSLFIGLHIFEIKKNQKRYEKYSPLASFYASQVVEIDNKINIYYKLISKLTR